MARSGIMMLAALLTWLVPATVSGHEGHDHGAPLPPVSKTIAPRADASSGDFELVLVARGPALEVRLDAFRTNEPIDGAEIEIDSPAGLLKPEPLAKEAGTYTVSAPFLAKPGSYDLAITINARGTVDILAARLVIPEPPTADRTQSSSWLTAPAVALDASGRGGDAGMPVWLYAVLSFLGGIIVARIFWPRRTASAATALMTLMSVSVLLSIVGAGQVLADSVDGAGRDVAQRFPDGSLFVPKPTQRILALRTIFTEVAEHHRTVELPGRIVPNPNASGLVQASIGGRLIAPEGGFKPLGTRVEAGDVLAYVRPPLPLADATTQQQQARELDQQISIVTRKVERLRAIQQVIAKSQLEDAELELKGLTTRRANLDRVQREPEALVSPVAGVLASANAVAGQMAEPNAIIFHIVDPDRLWIEALSYDAPSLTGTAQARLADGKVLEAEHAGTGFSDRNQAVPIHFSVKSKANGLRAGQFVTVLASTGDVRRGVALPREAVLRASNGQALVFEHTNAERFVPREVRVEPLDGATVLIVAGIEQGRRVVTQGAELLSQIR